MALSGNIHDFPLPDVLQLLLQQKKTGVLTLSDGRQAAELYVSQGNISGVRLGEGGPEAKIKEMLVAAGRIEAKEFDDLQAVSQQMNRPVLATLVAKGHVTEEEREQWLQMAAEDMVCDLFAWEQGRYEFTGGQKAPGPGAALLDLPTEFACMEGMRRIDEWPRLRERLPSDKLVFRPLEAAAGAAPQGAEALVLRAVDGRKTLRQLERELPCGSFRLYDCIVNLWGDGYIEPLEAIAEGAGPAAPAEKAAERDQKTALVLGVATLVFLLACVIRFMVLGILGMGSLTSDHYAADVENALVRDNLETFLAYHAALKGSMPRGLSQLGREGYLRPGELKGALDKKFAYRRTGPMDYTLK